LPENLNNLQVYKGSAHISGDFQCAKLFHQLVSGNKVTAGWLQYHACKQAVIVSLFNNID